MIYNRCGLWMPIKCGYVVHPTEKRRLLTTPLIAKPDIHRKLTQFQNGTVSDWVLIILAL